MKKLLVALLCLGLTGCATTSTATAFNRQNLLKLSIGMSKAKTIDIMGTKAVKAYGDPFYFKDLVLINNPYRSEILQGKDKTLEIVYYVTDVKRNDGAITDDELTPLVFDDGKLIGWGWSFLQDNVNKYEIRMR